MWSAYRLTSPLSAHRPGEREKIIIPTGEVIEYMPKPESGTTIAVLWRDQPVMVSESELRGHAEHVKSHRVSAVGAPSSILIAVKQTRP